MYKPCQKVSRDVTGEKAHLSNVLLLERLQVLVQRVAQGVLQGHKPTQSCLNPIVDMQSGPAQTMPNSDFDKCHSNGL